MSFVNLVAPPLPKKFLVGESLMRENFVNQSDLSIQKFEKEIGVKFVIFGQFKVCFVGLLRVFVLQNRLFSDVSADVFLGSTL